MATKQAQRIFTLGQIAMALFRDQGIHSGLWRLGFGLRFAAANTGPSDDNMMPSGIVAIESFVLEPASTLGPLVFDAAASSSESPAARPSPKGSHPSQKSGMAAALESPAAPRKAVRKAAKKV